MSMAHKRLENKILLLILRKTITVIENVAKKKQVRKKSTWKKGRKVIHIQKKRSKEVETIHNLKAQK